MPLVSPSMWILVVAARSDRGRARRGHPRYVDLLVLVLQLIKFVVNPTLGDQLLMRSHFAYLALVHDDDLVGALNRGEAMRDDQRGTAFDHAVEGVTDAEFSLGIYAGGGFVENQNFRIVRQSTGE